MDKATLKKAREEIENCIMNSNSTLSKDFKIYNMIDLEETDKKIKVYSEMANVKRKRITIPKGPNTTYHRAYMMDLILEGDLHQNNPRM